MLGKIRSGSSIFSPSFFLPSSKEPSRFLGTRKKNRAWSQLQQSCLPPEPNTHKEKCVESGHTKKFFFLPKATTKPRCSLFSEHLFPSLQYVVLGRQTLMIILERSSHPRPVPSPLRPLPWERPPIGLRSCSNGRKWNSTLSKIRIVSRR